MYSFRFSYLRTNRLNKTQKGPSNSLQIAAAAKKLEAHLFRTATSLREYQDQSTLNNRFQRLVSAMLERRLQKAEEAAVESSSPTHRLKVLSNTLKPDTCRKIFYLVRQIECLQVGKPLGGARAGSAITSPSTGPSFHLGGQQVLPKEVRSIFFDLTIVDAFYNTPLSRLSDLPWPRLIIKAEKSINDYQKWIAQPKED